MSNNIAKYINNIIAHGYNPFDIKDKFYKEICTPYESENGTDVLLDSREEYFYTSLKTIVCLDECSTSSYPLITRYLKCNCKIDSSDINLDLMHMTGKNVVKNSKSKIKNLNWRAMICIELVFNKKIFAKNIGSILSLVILIIYLGFFVYYIFKGITPLQENIEEIMSKEGKEEKIDSQDNGKNPTVIIFKNPHKMPKSSNDDNKYKNSTRLTIMRKTNDIKIIPLNNDKNKKVITNIGFGNKNFDKILNKKDSIYTEQLNLNNKKETEYNNNNEEKYKNLDDLQLNNLEYFEACKYDKRSFLKIYWSILKREHIILLIFFSRKDYNLFYIKIERLLFLLCTQMFMSGLFFTDKYMHKANKTDNYNFGEQFPKIVFSLIITHAIEVFLCYLSMTDTTIYQIKELAKRKNMEEIISEKINTMRKKLIGFFIVTLILFVFYWYFISAFCAVFQNTQKILLLDFFISTILEYIDPFVIYFLKVALRQISITKLLNLKGKFVYKISVLIPIF